VVAVLEALDSSDSVALNSPRRARVVDEAGLEEIEMCDAGLAGVELRACEHNSAGFKSMAVSRRGYLPSMSASRIAS
jgi:hypothetical protein